MKAISLSLLLFPLLIVQSLADEPAKNKLLGSWTLNCEFTRVAAQSGTFVPLCPMDLKDNSLRISPMVVYFSSDSLSLQDTTVNYRLTNDSLFFNYNEVEWKFRVDYSKKKQIRLWAEENAVLLERRAKK